MTDSAHLVAGTITAAASCLASAVITTVVAIEAPAETADALFTSLLVVVLGLWRARQIAAPPKERAAAPVVGGEPSVAQDPTQRRIDRVLGMVSTKAISPDEGERLIANLRGHSPSVDAPVPPYGTSGGQA